MALLERTKVFAEIKKYARTIEDGPFTNARAVRSLINKVESFNPVLLANQSWQQSLIQQDDRIGFFNKDQVVESMIYLGKFDILRTNLSDCIVDFVQSRSVIYESGCLIRSDSQTSTKTLESLSQFISHLHSQSITFSRDQTDKLENYIIDSILRPSIPLESEEDDEAFVDVKKLFELSLKISPDFKKIPEMVQNLSSALSEKSSARLLARYRRILSTGDLMSTIAPSSQKRYLSHKSTSQSSTKLSLTSQLKVQNPDSPISSFCAQGWLIMLKNPNMASRIIQLYKVFVFNRFSGQLAENLEFVNILSNDIDWFAGCLARLHLVKEIGCFYTEN
ncbi:unnamed protein product [Oikopleura dioica]|uniref:Uncharacterized protein n=1 Tax=Oikopleura dioica TaxID=34765 RepID=E4YPF4_OIKDI|nr:unnamed protein product [Oikopleura dioica]